MVLKYGNQRENHEADQICTPQVPEKLAERRCVREKPKEGMMLVVSRKPRESIHIGNSIVVTVKEIVGNRVRLGIEAPKVIRILRAELLEQEVEQPTVSLPSVVDTGSPQSDGPSA